MDRELIIRVAKSKGFKLPPWSCVSYRTSTSHNATSKKVLLTEKDIRVHRPKTIFGNDLGEYWVDYPHSLTQFVVKDEDLRDEKLTQILNE